MHFWNLKKSLKRWKESIRGLLISEYSHICTKASSFLSLPSRDCHRADAKLVPWEPGSGRSLLSPGAATLPREVAVLPDPSGWSGRRDWASSWHSSDKSEIYFQNSPALLTPLCHVFTQTGLAAQKLYLSCQLAHLIN